jgi:peptidyl-prolyl cis-trans isomerase C
MKNKFLSIFREIVFIFLCLCSGIYFSCHSKMEDSNIAARVGDAVLTQDDLKKRLTLEGLEPDRKSEVVENWINQELLYQEAKRAGIESTDELKWELENIEKQFLVNKLVEKTFAEKIHLLDSEIQDYYEKNKSLFTVDEDEVHLFHIMTKTQVEAELVLQEIRAGKPFEQVAKERSADLFREKGGDMGFVKRNDILPDLAKATFSLPEGGMSTILKSNDGFHIQKIIKKYVKGSVKDFADAKDEIFQRLRVNKERSVYYDLLYQLKNKQKVYIAEAQKFPITRK